MQDEEKLSIDLLLKLKKAANEFGMTTNELLEYMLGVLASPALISRPKKLTDSLDSQAESSDQVHGNQNQDDEFHEVELQLKRLGYA
jgi:hypothetical protein